MKKGKNKGYTYRYNKSGTVTCRKYFDMPNGTREQLPATGNTEAEARKKLDEKYSKICKQGKKIKSQGYTIKSWCHYWLFTIKKPTLKGYTFDNYRKKIEKNVYPRLGSKKLNSLTLLDIQKLINFLETRPSKKDPTKKLKGKTIKDIVDPFLQALDYAMDSNLMPYISFKRLELPPVKKGTREIRNKTEQQIVADYFCNKIPGKTFDLYYAPIVVADSRGLRPEEVGRFAMERFKL